MTHPGPASAGRPEADGGGQPSAGSPSETVDLDELPPFDLGSPSPKRQQGLLIGIVVAVVVVIAAGIGTWVAVHRGSGVGSGSPQDAATKLVTDVGNDDLLGVVNDLPPNESALLRGTLNDAAAQLKRLQVVKPGVSAQAATGLSLHASGIQFDTGAVQQVNGHIAITKLVAGKITFGAGLTSDQYTDSFLHAAFPGGKPTAGQGTTVDIAQTVKRLGHPIGIATVKVNGRWYPSLFYTIAEASLEAANQQWPSTTIAPIGADVPNEAAEDFLQAVLNSDAQNAIARTSPDEMAVLHDMGLALVKRNQVTHNITIRQITFDDRNVTGGVEAVLRNMTLIVNGQRIVVTHTAGCYTVQTGAGRPESLCGTGIADQLRADPATKSLPDAVVKPLVDMFTGLAGNGVGIVTTESAETWYVDPGRSITQLVHDMEGSLTPQDITGLLQVQGH
jgi:hypothetical protein